MISLAHREITAAYQRGYKDGRTNKWPHHIPPEMPDEVVSGLISAMREMRDMADITAAAIGGDEDEVGRRLGEIIDRCDEAMLKVHEWLTKS